MIQQYIVNSSPKGYFRGKSKMKKRLISILLTICMVTCLFSGMSITAHADGVKTTEYTLQAGDNVYTVCKRLGIDFYANYDWITKTNNIKNYSALSVGTKLILPLGDTTGIVAGGSANSGSSTVTPGSASLKVQGNDKIVSYLVPHTVAYGETLYDLCNAKGINYKDNVDYILKLNGLKNANRIAVGRTLLFPATKAPAAGSCIAVVSHKIVSGDATYNLCQSYGISYADNLELMKVLNNKSNMASIKTGQTLLLPVPTTIVPASSGGNGDNSGSNVGSNNNNNSGSDNTNNNNSGSNNADKTAYKITQNTTNVNEGSYSILVNNKSQSTAVSGDTVTVNVTAKKGYRLDYVSVVDAKGNSIKVNTTTFTMPASDVTISVKFVADADYKITSAYSNNGSFTVTVNGDEVNKAAEGQTVKINADPAFGYELESITVTRSTNSATTLTVTNQSFVMPKYDVTVKVTFKSAVAHDIELGTYAYGTFTTSINGSTVTKAMSGDIVKVDTKPLDGYGVSKITVTGVNNGEKVEVNGDSFVMPAYKVKVEVKFSADEFNVIANSSTGGTYTVNKTTAKVGDWMQVVATPDTGYVVDKVYYTDGEGKQVEVTSSDYSFLMPARDTTISVSFRLRPYYFTVDSCTKLYVGSEEVTTAKYGETVTIKVNPTAGYKVKEVTAKRTANGKAIDITANKDGSYKLTMPAGNVTIEVKYAMVDYKLSASVPKVKDKTPGSVKFEVGGVETTTAQMGQCVKVVIDAKDGYTPTSIVVTCDGKEVGVNGGTGEFQMPAGAVKVTVTFTKNS